MSMDYNRIARGVAQKLAKYGQTVVLRQYPQASGYNPATLKVVPAGEPTVSNRKALVTDQPSTRIGPQYGTNTRPNSTAEKAQKWIYLDALGAAPKPNDKITIQGTDYVVEDVQETAPGGIVLFYLVVLNR